MLQTAIIQTLCYSQVFHFPLTLEEIHTRLIAYKASRQKVSRALGNLKIKAKSGYYYLDKSEIVESRIKKEAHTFQKIVRAKKICNRLLKHIPYIEAIFITGTVAVNNAKKNDDIDLLIITKANKLWTARLITNCLLDILNQRRKPDTKNPTNKLCLNLWLSRNDLKIKKINQNLYTAYEVMQVKPIFDRGGVHNQFLYENRWIKKFLPNVKIPNKIDLESSKTKASLSENLAYFLQKKYMSSKVTTEKVSNTAAYFHPRNTAEQIEKKFKKIVSQYT